MPERKLDGYPCPVCRAMITGIVIKEENILESKRSPALVPAKCPSMHDIALYVDKQFKIRDAEPLVDLKQDLGRCPYCDFHGSSDETIAHISGHILSVNARIDSVNVDYGNKVAFVHVVVGQGGNAKGFDVAVPLPRDMKILGKVVLESVSFGLYPE
ncbi:MAG: hypothetical protein WED05_00425 [Candidatus Atabeyarchaeum deiterrae]